MAALSVLGTTIEELPSQEWNPRASTIGGVRDIHLCSLAPRNDDWSFLLLHLNSQLGEALAMALSRALDHPTIVFHEYEELAWGFVVYRSGDAIARFWNRPDVVELDPASCRASPEVIAGAFGVDPQTVAGYLRHLDAGESPGKVFSDDGRTLDRHWVRVDFMKRLGMDYPDPGTRGSRHVLVRERGVNR